MSNEKRKVPRYWKCSEDVQTWAQYIYARRVYVQGMNYPEGSATPSLFNISSIQDETYGNSSFIKCCKNHIQKDIKSLKSFNESSGWARNFMKLDRSVSSKKACLVGHISPQTLRNSCDELGRGTCKVSIEDICNTDKTVVLFPSFRGRAIGTSDQPSMYERVNERLTAVLTVFVYGAKVPSSIIRRAHHPRSYPSCFYWMKDTRLFYQIGNNASNSAHLGIRTFSRVNKISEFRSRRTTSIIDNFSAHALKYSQFGNYEVIFLLPNMASALEPVDVAIGRPLKCAFRRLSIDDLIEYVNI